MSARRWVVDGCRMEVDLSTDDRWSGSCGRYTVGLAVDGGARYGRPADGVEARIVEPEHVTSAHSYVLLGVHQHVDVA